MDRKKDGLRPSSLYIASDSRVSWDNGTFFDHGRKVFGCKNSPDIFGYCGDVLFPSIVLNQIVDLIDEGLLFKPEWSCEEKFQVFINKVIQSFNNYPKEISSITSDSLEIIHASRDLNKTFFCRKMKWTRKDTRWTAEVVDFGKGSNKLFVAGSAATEFKKKFDEHWASQNSGTSRAVFHAFCDTLAETKDARVGGPPQVFGLYRKFNAIPLGIIKDKKRYFNGLEVTDLTNFNQIAWRNELFEICDGHTMKIKPNSQAQPNPLKN